MDKTVVCVGMYLVDILGRPVTHIPEGQHVAILDEIRITVAGTAAGTSVDLAKLGANVIAMGACGEDDLGNFLINTLERYGIESRYMIRKKGVQTSATILPIRPNGERPALHVPGTNNEFSFQDLDLDVIAAADFLHMGGTSLLEKFDGEPTRKMLEYAKEQGVITTFDLVAVKRSDLLDLVEPCLPFIDYFMPGLEEAVMMCGLEKRQDVMKFFLDRGTKHTVFKMGAEGSSIGWLEDGQIQEIRLPAFKVPVVDSTGCGDGYCAGFIMGLCMGWDLERAGKLGTAAASLVLQGLGSDAGIVDLDQTSELMNSTDTLPMTM